MNTRVEAPARRPSAFARLYAWMRASAGKPGAVWLLAALSAAESSFFPIPPDVMLAPMTLERPRAWFWLASVTTASSVLGGLGGYAIGHYLIQWAYPLIVSMGYADAFASAKLFFAKYGFYALIIKGLTPFPYKIFTITAGAVSMPVLPFVGASIIGRGMRFYLVAGLIRMVGPHVEATLARYIDWFGWGLLLLIASGFVWLRYHH